MGAKPSQVGRAKFAPFFKRKMFDVITQAQSYRDTTKVQRYSQVTHLFSCIT